MSIVFKLASITMNVIGLTAAWSAYLITMLCFFLYMEEFTMWLSVMLDPILRSYLN